jgi:predicted secreted Zn-dependent protease
MINSRTRICLPQLIRWLALTALILVACQDPTPEPESSLPLPSPGISVIKSNKTTAEPVLTEEVANLLIATAAVDPGEPPSYVEGSSGEELVPFTGAQIIYYEIEGSSEQELRAQLDEMGPVDSSGYKGDALTEWEVSWNWPGYGSGDCDLSQAEVTYTVKVLFPRWNPPEDASNNLILKWFNYTYRLAKHEQGHVDYVVENYGIVNDAIQEATCETADEAALAALEPLHAFDLEYDRQTGHGTTQGARFP